MKSLHPRIILLDDGDIMVAFWEAILRLHFSEATILGFIDSVAALHEMDRTVPDLLVMDWQRPHINGADMLRILARRNAVFPILVASGFATEDMIEESAAAFQKVSLLQKPFGPTEFVQRVSSLIDATH